MTFVQTGASKKFSPRSNKRPRHPETIKRSTRFPYHHSPPKTNKRHCQTRCEPVIQRTISTFGHFRPDTETEYPVVSPTPGHFRPDSAMKKYKRTAVYELYRTDFVQALAVTKALSTWTTPYTSTICLFYGHCNFYVRTLSTRTTSRRFCLFQQISTLGIPFCPVSLSSVVCPYQ